MDPELRKSLKLLVRMAIVAIILLVVYLLFIYVLPLLGRLLAAIPKYIMPFLVAILFAIVMEPVVEFFERKLKLRRGWAVFTSLVLVWGTVAFSLTALIVRLTEELIGLYKVLVEHSEQITTSIVDGLARIQLFYVQLNLPDNVQASAQKSLLQYFGNLETVLNHSANALVGFLGAMPGFMIFLLIATVATFFIMKDRAWLRESFMAVIPESWRGTTRSVINDLFGVFAGFLKAYSFLVMMTALQTIIGLKLLGVNYALTLGLVTGLLDILPIVGPGIVFLPWIGYSLLTANTKFAIGLLVLYGVVTGVRQVLEPKVVGDSIGLHPLATLVSLYVGLKLLGPVGLILGPVVVILYLAFQRSGAFERLGMYFRRVL